MIHETNNDDACHQCKVLVEEAENFRKLGSSGYDVPNVADEIVVVTDHLHADGEKRAAALIVEHISGSGPYKPVTETHLISKAVENAKKGLQAEYYSSWDKLVTAVAKAAPMDLQVILSDDGRIMTIDPEKIGPGKQLKSLI